jgi:hypothetical protein
MRRPILPPNPSRDLALRDLPEDADVRIFTADSIQQQGVSTLKPGTAAKGRVDFGDATGSRRLRLGDTLLILATQGEGLIAQVITDPQPATEILVLKRFTQPLTAFDRA